MIARAFWCMSILVLLCGVARADMGVPGMKRPKVINRIRITDEYPDHVFIVVHVFYAGKDQPEKTSEYATLTPDQPLDVFGVRWQQVELLVVTRVVAAKYPTALALVEAKAPVVGRFTLSFDESVPVWYGDQFTINHRFQRNGSGGFELVRTTSETGWQCCVVLIAFPLAIIWLGVRFIRWLLRGVNKSPVPPPSDAGSS